jgi:hypothetical protein
VVMFGGIGTSNDLENEYAIVSFSETVVTVRQVPRKGQGLWYYCQYNIQTFSSRTCPLHLS